MGIHLLPFAVGAAIGTAAAYLLGDEHTRRRIASESSRVGRAVGDYLTGLFAGRRTAYTDYTADRAGEAPAAAGPDHERCEALTKAGRRCRAKPNRVVAFPQTSGGAQEHGLCWRHAQAFERGDALELAQTPPVEETTRH